MNNSVKPPKLFASCILFFLLQCSLELAGPIELAIPNLLTTIIVIFVKLFVITDSSEDGVPQCHRKC